MKRLSLILMVPILLFPSACSSGNDVNSYSKGDAVSQHWSNDSEPSPNLPGTDDDIRDATFEKLKLIGRAAVEGDVETFKANTGKDFHIVLFPKGRKAGSIVISEIRNHQFAESLEFSQPSVVSNYDGSVWLQVKQILTTKNGNPIEKQIFAYFENFDNPARREWKLKYLKEENFP